MLRPYKGIWPKLGERVFVADMKEPGMLFGALRFSDHPRAKVLRVDVSKALEVPGVVRVLTSKHIPGTRIVGMIFKDWPVMVAEGEETRYIGDVLEDESQSVPKAGTAGRPINVLDAFPERVMICGQLRYDLDLVGEGQNCNSISRPRGVDKTPGRLTNQTDLIRGRA